MDSVSHDEEYIEMKGKAEGGAVPSEPSQPETRKLFGVVPVGCLPPKLQRKLLSDQLLVGTVLGVVLGLVLGFALAPTNMPKWANDLLSLPGNCFLRMLKMLVLPLVMGSIVGGVLNLRRIGGAGSVGRVARRTLSLYLLTYILAVVTGLILVTSIRPGSGLRKPESLAPPSPSPPPAPLTLEQRVAALEQGEKPPPPTPAVRWQCRDDASAVSTIEKRKAADSNILDSFTNVIYGAIPTNLFQAAAESNMLGLITFCIALAIVLPVNTGSQPLTGAERAVRGFNHAIGAIVNAVLMTSPVGIFSLIAGKITAACDVAKMFSALGLFIATVVSGLAIHAFITLPACLWIFTRHNPLRYFMTFSRAIITAFAISSSAATLSVNMKCAQDYGVNPDLANFVLVLGATVNMDGTAMYEGVCALFIAQLNGRSLSVAQMIIVAITGSLAAMGAAAIPSAGLVTLVMVLQAVDMAEFADDIAMILVVDWFLDRIRTAVNVMGDGVAACILQHYFGSSMPSPIELPTSFSRHEVYDYRDPQRTGVYAFTEGDLVSYHTIDGVRTGGVIHEVNEGQEGSPTTYTLRNHANQALEGWRHSWLTVDASVEHRITQLESGSSPQQREPRSTSSAGLWQRLATSNLVPVKDADDRNPTL